MDSYMNNLNSFLIGSHIIGSTHPPLFLPDIGTFFNQDIDLAFLMIDTLKAANINIIKGEILHTANICLPIKHNENYLSNDGKTVTSENYRQLIERKTVSLPDYRKIFGYCRNRELEFVVSVYDEEGAVFAKEQNAAAIKISSSNITHYPLINFVAKLGLPMIIDTGHSTISEAVRAIKWCRDAGESRLVVQHSPPAPPESIHKHNLNMMLSLGKECQSYTGLSDHHKGTEMLIAATAMGAQVIEKGVFPLGLENEQDINHAMPIDYAGSLSKTINMVFHALGKGENREPDGKRPYQSRMCLIAKQNLEPGDTIILDKVSFAFPPLGIGCEHWLDVVGKTIKKCIQKGKAITWEHL